MTKFVLKSLIIDHYMKCNRKRVLGRSNYNIFAEICRNNTRLPLRKSLFSFERYVEFVFCILGVFKEYLNFENRSSVPKNV